MANQPDGDPAPESPPPTPPTAAPNPEQPPQPERAERVPPIIEDGGTVQVEESSTRRTTTTISPADSELEEGDKIGGVVSPFEVAPFTRETPKGQVAAYLAYFLLAVLALTIVLQYTIVWWLTYYALGTNRTADDLEKLYKPIEQIFNTLLPVLAGLVGSAVTYYFTREPRSS